MWGYRETIEMTEPLLHAVFVNDIHSVSKCLARGADANVRDKDGRTPLMHAAIDGKADFTRRSLTMVQIPI
jgi:ankyrin repeat protein